MIRVIEGKRYNTETAEEVAEHESNANKGDFRWYTEKLFKTPKGNFFLCGEGHASSKYAEPCGDMQGPGDGVIPLSRREALEWCERYAQEEIDIHFESEVTDA